MSLPPARSPAFRLASVAILSAALTLAGCASTVGSARAPARIQEIPERICVRVSHAAMVPGVDGTADVPANAAAGGQPLPDDSLPFSRAAQETAAAIGILPQLKVIAGMKAAGGSREQVLLARQAVMERVTLTMLDVASVTGEIDCENERSALLRDQLQRLEEQRLRGLTVAGLVIGAATAIVSGGIALYDSDAVAASVINVVGGTAQAGTGFATLSYTPVARLRHERNVLADIWHGKPDSALFPPAIWRFLNDVHEEDSEVPLRQALVAQWKAGERLGPGGSEEEKRRAALIFGKGGEYTAEDLRARDAILDQLEATVKLLYQDLGLLMRELAASAASTAGAGNSGGTPGTPGASGTERAPGRPAATKPRTPVTPR